MSLFPDRDKRRFTEITGQRYDAMRVRLAKKGLPLPQFTKEQLRHLLYLRLGEDYGGAIRCKYCGKMCGVEEVHFDHAVPLIRGGSLDLSNIEFPCAQCNSAKGEMTPQEYLSLLTFLEQQIPLARTDIMHRLSTYGKLVSGKRKADMMARNNGQLPPKKKKQKPPLVAAIEDKF